MMGEVLFIHLLMVTQEAVAVEQELQEALQQLILLVLRYLVVEVV
tara:strand:- start:271 stop:405 length:135 start_codon:yes stop_codon:yes gene_type:complete